MLGLPSILVRTGWGKVKSVVSVMLLLVLMLASVADVGVGFVSKASLAAAISVVIFVDRRLGRCWLGKSEWVDG